MKQDFKLIILIIEFYHFWFVCVCVYTCVCVCVHLFIYMCICPYVDLSTWITDICRGQKNVWVTFPGDRVKGHLWAAWLGAGDCPATKAARTRKSQALRLWTPSFTQQMQLFLEFSIDYDTGRLLGLVAVLKNTSIYSLSLKIYII